MHSAPSHKPLGNVAFDALTVIVGQLSKMEPVPMGKFKSSPFGTSEPIWQYDLRGLSEVDRKLFIRRFLGGLA